MKGTELFKAAIQNYLEYRAMTDDLFAPRYANPAKNIDDCITYILNEVQKSGMNGFDDDEIYSMAITTSLVMMQLSSQQKPIRTVI